MRYPVAVTTAILAFMVTGCTPIASPTAPIEPTANATTTATTAPATAGATETQYGYITNVVTRNGTTHLDVDYIEILSGLEGAVAYVEDGKCDRRLADATSAGKQKLVNALRTNEKIFDNYDCNEKLVEKTLGKYFTNIEYLCTSCFMSPSGAPYDRNRNPKIRTLPLASTATIQIIYDYLNKGWSDGQHHIISIGELQQIVEKEKRTPAPAGGEQFYPPYKIIISNGTIAELTEIYRP